MKIIEAFLTLTLAGWTLAVAPTRTRGAAHKASESHRDLQPTTLEDKDIDVDSVLGIGCFSEVATVQVRGRGPVAMKDLGVGDEVLTSGKSYQSVYSFGHYNPNKPAEFQQLHTEEGAPLELTGEHLVFVKDKVHPVRADSLKVGDALLGRQGEGHIITNITTVQRLGVYAPFTRDGTLVVDGIVASTYISLQKGQDFLRMQNGRILPFSQHDYVHMGISPLRLLCGGVSSRYCTDYNSEGIPAFAAWAIDVNLWTMQQPVVVQVFFLALFLMLIVPCLVAETLVGPGLAPMAIVGLGCILLRVGRNQNQKVKTL